MSHHLQIWTLRGWGLRDHRRHRSLLRDSPRDDSSDHDECVVRCLVESSWKGLSECTPRDVANSAAQDDG